MGNKHTYYVCVCRRKEIDIGLMGMGMGTQPIYGIDSTELIIVQWHFDGINAIMCSYILVLNAKRYLIGHSSRSAANTHCMERTSVFWVSEWGSCAFFSSCAASWHCNPFKENLLFFDKALLFSHFARVKCVVWTLLILLFIFFLISLFRRFSWPSPYSFAFPHLRNKRKRKCAINFSAFMSRSLSYESQKPTNCTACKHS